MPKQLCIFLLIFLAFMPQIFYVSSVGAPGDTMSTISASRYSAHSSSEPSVHQQQQNQPQIHQHQQQQPSIAHHPGGGGGSNNINNAPSLVSHALYHPGSGSGGHVDNRNSYNLLSEAMSQAVSNEFSSLGSGSADGACHADDLDCYSGNMQDRLGMEAIRTLHRQLDDDDNGNIDLSESDDFLREELKYDSGYEKRQKAFHFNDDMHISVKELWEAWLRSEVHNWTIEQTTDWLAQSVQLPQYVELFKLHKVTGAALPRLAVNNMHYVSNVLGIKDPIHKQKIALKAMDVVLFGPPRETGTRWKDYILVTLLLSAIIGCWYAYQQNKNAKRHLRRMAQDMEGLQRAEQSLQEMQKELERARMEQENVATEKMDLERRLKEAPGLTTSNSDLEVQQLKKEIEMLRSELSRAEIELVDNCWAPPPQLQSWLQYTYELENKNHLKKRVAAEKQLQSAREACEKLRKKRSSLVGAFVSTHGKSIDDVDRSIVEARNSLGEVTNELQERLHRWKQIESCLGLNIVNNNGLTYLESVLYGRNGGSTKGSRGRMTNSTDDLDDDSVQARCYDRIAQILYRWRSMVAAPDSISNNSSSSSNHSNAHQSPLLVHYNNNTLSQVDQAQCQLPLPAVIAARKWLNSIAQRANSPARQHHPPSNLHHQPQQQQGMTPQKDSHPIDGHRTNELQQLQKIDVPSTCSNSNRHNALLTQVNSSEIMNTSLCNLNTHQTSIRPQEQQFQLEQIQQQSTSNLSCQPQLVCNPYVENRNMATLAPPPPELRPLLRRHTVIPKWRINTYGQLTQQIQQASMAASRSANDACVSLSEAKSPSATTAAVAVPATATSIVEVSKTNLFNSHSAGCLANTSDADLSNSERIT